MMFTMTTSKRPALFERTMDSLKANCRDLFLIKKAIIVDDASSEADLYFMAKKVHATFRPEFEIHTSDEPEGHSLRMQTWFKELEGDFVFHCEDDWEFTVPGCPVLAALDVLANDPSIGQVALSRDIPSKTPKQTPTGTNYWIWEYDGSLNYVDGIPWSWPCYTTNPSIFRVSAIRKVGPTENIPGAEHSYGLRWVAAGFKTAYLMPQFCRHMDGEVSAFDINGTTR